MSIQCFFEGDEYFHFISYFFVGNSFERSHKVFDKTDRVLIDDRSELRAMWEKKGGIFIHHTDTKSTLLKLEKAGIIGDQSS